jgi:hypothetical protein
MYPVRVKAPVRVITTKPWIIRTPKRASHHTDAVVTRGNSGIVRSLHILFCAGCFRILRGIRNLVYVK